MISPAAVITPPVFSTPKHTAARSDHPIWRNSRTCEKMENQRLVSEFAPYPLEALQRQIWLTRSKSDIAESFSYPIHEENIVIQSQPDKHGE
jgi:hypothetical protein